MEKLTIKELAPYLPYGLKVLRKNRVLEDDIFIIKGATNELVFKDEEAYSVVDISRVKPILRPLSDLTKEIKVNSEKFVPLLKLDYIVNSVDDIMFLEDINENIFYRMDLEKISFNTIQKLLEWHFDVFGLIEKGLAIDINTL